MPETREIKFAPGKIGFLLAPGHSGKQGRASAGQLDLDRKLTKAIELENALTAAIQAAVKAQQFAATKGFVCAFEAGTIWDMAKIGFLLAPGHSGKQGRASAGQLDLDRKLTKAIELENALTAAIQAAVKAQQFAATKGFVCAFEAGTIWDMASMLMEDEDTHAVGDELDVREPADADLPWLGEPGAEARTQVTP